MSAALELSNLATEPKSEGNTEGLVEIEVETALEESPQPGTEQLQRILSEKQPFVATEDTDPIEWAVRSTIPIPKQYYWDVVKDKEKQNEIPRNIRLWHNTIGSLEQAYNWTERKIAKPLAGSLGLTDSRFDYVTSYMTDEELAESRAKAKEREKQIREKKDDLELETLQDNEL